jgi:hypothetical protein
MAFAARARRVMMVQKGMDGLNPRHAQEKADRANHTDRILQTHAGHVPIPTNCRSAAKQSLKA